MMLSPWILGLLTGQAALLFIFTSAFFNAWKIFRHWNYNSSSPKQYQLEKRTYLVSTVVNFAIGIQMILLLLLVLTADEISKVLPGAMCATGSFAANEFGFPLLFLKIFSFFACFIWLNLNYLDNQLETYPIIRKKYLLLVLIYPLVVIEGVLLFLYAYNLNPEIITSCCGTVYSEGSSDMGGLIAGASPWLVLPALFILVGWIVVEHQLRKWNPLPKKITGIVNIVTWVLFFLVSISAIISFFSIYIYEMPTHKCPFCFIKGEYYYIGIPLYFTLFFATAAGLTQGSIYLIQKNELFSGKATILQDRMRRLSIVFMLFFILISFAPFIIYYLKTGRLI